MPDVFTPAKRSAVMSLIRSTGNAATELRLMALLRAEKITGWRRHLPLTLPPLPRPSKQAQAQASGKGKATGRAKASDKTQAPPALRSSPGTHAAQSPGKGAVKSARRPRVRPDFVFREARLVIFVDGCFWHGCPRHGTRPQQNRKFWDEKIARNRRRDRLVTRQLRKQGWTVLRLWECALARKRQVRTLGRLRRALGK